MGITSTFSHPVLVLVLMTVIVVIHLPFLQGVFLVLNAMRRAKKLEPVLP